MPGTDNLYKLIIMLYMVLTTIAIYLAIAIVKLCCFLHSFVHTVHYDGFYFPIASLSSEDS